MATDSKECIEIDLKRARPHVPPNHPNELSGHCAHYSKLCFRTIYRIHITTHPPNQEACSCGLFSQMANMYVNAHGTHASIAARTRGDPKVSRAEARGSANAPFYIHHSPSHCGTSHLPQRLHAPAGRNVEDAASRQPSVGANFQPHWVCQDAAGAARSHAMQCTRW
jgi:hypothetical protein